MQLMEQRLGRPLDEILQELYIEKGMTTKQVAVELGVSQASVSRWMAQLGVEARYIGPEKVAV
jgi:transposase-like protein